MIICSLAAGAAHIEMMQLMAPTVNYYANTHKMDVLLLSLPDIRLAPARPPAWDKIILIRHMLELYETVMWIDSDALFCQSKPDIREELDPDCPMHIVFHHVGRSLIPNTGVWVCRRLPETLELLNAIWNHTSFINHRWWEQGALMDLIGCDPAKCRFVKQTSYTSMVRHLNHKWNSRQSDSAKNPVIYHYCSKPKPIDNMQLRYRRFLAQKMKLPLDGTY
jgi:hypothetical protein